MYWRTQLLIMPTSLSPVVNPNNCSLRLTAYSCGNPNEVNFSIPRMTFDTYLPQVAGNINLQWQPYNWLSLNQTTNYSVLRYNLTALQVSTGQLFTVASGKPSDVIYGPNLYVNGNKYSLANHPNFYDSGWSINETMFSDNTCYEPGGYTNPAQCYGNTATGVWARFSPGTYCRMIVQYLFNGNSTLAYDILGKTGLWTNLIIEGFQGWENYDVTVPPILNGPNPFNFGDFNCTWFMEKYIWSIYGPNISMSDPFIDAIPLTVDDWLSYGQYSLANWTGTYLGICHYDGWDLYSLIYQTGDYAYDLFPPGSPSFINTSVTSLLTPYWGKGCPFWFDT